MLRVSTSLRVLAFLPRAAAIRLSDALMPDHELRLAPSWSETRTRRSLLCTDASDLDVAVLDPSAGGATGFSACIGLARWAPHLPVVLYVPLTPEAANAILAFPRRRVHGLVLRDHDDGRERLRRVVEEAGGASVALRFVRQLHTQLGILPRSLHDAVRKAFVHPASLPDVDALSAAAGLTRRSVDRWFRRAGIAPASCVLDIAHTLGAYRAMRGTKLGTAAAARRLGYQSARALVRRTSAATGATPAALREMPEPGLLALLQDRVLRIQTRSA